MAEEGGQHRGRLKRKIMVMAILPLLAAQGLMVGLVYAMGSQGLGEARADLERTWVERSQDSAGAFANAIEGASAQGNRTRLQALVDAFVPQRPDLLQVRVLVQDPGTPGGFTVGAASNASLLGTPPDPLELRVLVTGRANHTLESAGGTTTLRVATPVHDPPAVTVGAATLTWSLASMDAEVAGLQRTFLTNLVIGAASLMAVSVLIFIMVINEISARITKPLATLRADAEAISTGNYDAPLDVRTDDEITDLAESFQRMTASLKIAAKLRLPPEPRSPVQ